ncbi:hypothetical protein Tco_1467774 [Tanacetum coccineum]
MVNFDYWSDLLDEFPHVLDDYLSRKQFGIQEYLRETKILDPTSLMATDATPFWYFQTEDKEYYLEHHIPVAPVAHLASNFLPKDLAAKLHGF